MNRFAVWALACVAAPSVFAAAGNIPGHGEGGPGDQETEQLGGLRFYAGATYDWVQLHISNSPLTHYNLQFTDLSFGYRLFKSLGLEVHGGVPTQGTDGIAGRARLNHDFGFFVVPNTVVFDTVELNFPIGYNIFNATAVSPGPVSSKGNVDSFSFGANLEFPIRVIDGGLPDLRIVAGGMMLSTHAAQQIYGFRAGLRYDFSFGSAPPSTPAGSDNATSGDSSSGGSAPAEGAAPASGSSSGGSAPASGSSAGSSAPASGSSSGSSAPASGSSAGAAAPASGSSAGAAAPASSSGAATPAAAGSSGSSAPASGSSGSGSAPASGSSSAPASSSSSAAATPAQ